MLAEILGRFFLPVAVISPLMRRSTLLAVALLMLALMAMTARTITH